VRLWCGLGPDLRQRQTKSLAVYPGGEGRYA
jgi:hypothetical protein